MRKIVVALAGTISGLIMLFSYHTSLGGTAAPAVPTSTGTTTTTVPGPTSDGTSGSTSNGASGSSSGSSGSASGTSTVTGDSVDTRWGPVQVQITVTNGKITAAQAVQVPNGNGRDAEINSYAVPILNQEAVQAQSAQIDAISGATVTSDGYVQSLQSAIDQAHL